MPGDYSRMTFDKKKHYSGVSMQQGRVQLDADWNEQLDIEQYRTFTESKDVIGVTGVPKNSKGFGISLSADGTDLVISPGRLYLEGLMCELESPPIVSYKNQPYYPSPDLSVFNLAGSPPSTGGIANGSYIVYLKAWQREVNYLDDPGIQEKALGEADTTTRLQTVWQVRLLKVQDDNGQGSCGANFPEWTALTAPVTGTLNAQTKKTDNKKDACALPPSAGYLRLENQLYRVQVQTTDAARNAKTFKWSRDNASVETGIITAINGKIITVNDLGKDDVLGFAGNQWVEIADDISTLNNKPRPLFQVASIDPDKRQVTLKTTPPTGIVVKQGLKLRRWDMDAVTGTPDGLPVVPGWMDIEDGVQVAFTGGSYEPGDYWLIPARTATGDIEWAREAGGLVPVPQTRKGTAYYYCRLAFARVQNGQTVLQDCRDFFPPLTEICAEDICYNNGNCSNTTATTVQQALDDLCRDRDGGCCTYTAVPGPGWESVFEKIKKDEDAQVCFGVGAYPLKTPVMISGKGHLKLIGCGPGSKISSPAAEAALVFSQCRSVRISDLYAEAGVANPKNVLLVKHLNGVFTFNNCDAVNVDHVTLKSGISNSRNATCITVNNTIKTPAPVRVEDCDLLIGNLQQGILLINVTQCWVENNSLQVYQSAAGTALNNAVNNKLMRAGVRNALISMPGFTSPIGIVERIPSNVTLKAGNFALKFNTNKTLRDAWQEVLAANPPKAVRSSRDLQKHVMKLADKLIADKTFLKKFPQFDAAIKAVLVQRAVASAGITIGGEMGTDLIVHNNVINGVLQGVHVGVSHASPNRTPDTTSNLSIKGNSINVVLPASTGKQERYGIFAGNTGNLLIEDNTIKLERLAAENNVAIDGIHVWGTLGPRLMITKNLVTSTVNNQKRSFDNGILVHPINERSGISQWVVMWNVAPSILNTVKSSNGVLVPQGTNTP